MSRSPLFRGFVQALQQARRENLKAAGEPPPLTKEQAGWTRRRFLKTAALACGAGMAASALPGLAVAQLRQPKIAIVGGGIAGLNAAYQLQKRGLVATVYEARDRLGGRIFSVTGAVGEGLITDLGGSFINTDHADMLALADELGLNLFNRHEDAARFPFPKTGYYFDNRIRSEKEVAKQLRPLAAQITADADLIDRDFERFVPALDQLSVDQYLQRHADKIPTPFVRTLIENSIRTEYGVEPKESSALQLLFNLPTMQGNRVEVLGASDETFVVEGGSGRIIDALAQALTGQIYTNMQLKRVHSRGQGFRLVFSRHHDTNEHHLFPHHSANADSLPHHSVDADYVILALPFTVLRQVNLEVDLPPTLRRFIHEVDLGSNEKLFAGFRQRIWRQSEGFVIDAWTDLGFSAVWEATQRQPEREDSALTFFFGGNEVDTLLHESAESGGQVFVERFEDFISGAQDAATGRFLRTKWTRSGLSRGAYTNFRPGQLTVFGDFFYIESDDPDERQDVHVSNLAFAGEQLSDAFYGFMNGAAQTGRLAAEIIARQVHQERPFSYWQF